ncbi:hypothetical protein AMC90_CH02791 [Rhizobium phaseoli]|uniref:hypothetical protein n=1 Tax=Rhizobium phaseoli TaxID=396 RepID=UPI0007E978F6|nr:hypothetical protein [Rhizobium phaseoli]ANL28593.1 hypothetical protein AMC90_CH02791 [Rhizobium phaseoli]
MRKGLSLPGIGRLRPTFDKINICTNTPRSVLAAQLPLEALKACSHAFKIEKRTGKRGSRLVLTALPDGKVLSLLRKHEALLGRYDITRVEVAADAKAPSVNEAKGVRDWLTQRMDKVNHERGHISFTDCFGDGQRLSEAELARRGLVDEPTVYFEKDKRAAHGLKLYIRREKLAKHKHGKDFVVRVEWTSAGSRAVKRHFGGNQISDLLHADLLAFVRNFLVLEEIDYPELGRLLSPRTTAGRCCHTHNRHHSEAALLLQDGNYRATRIAHLAIQIFEQRRWPSHSDREPIPEEIWRSSPAQIKGRIRDHLKSPRKRRGANTRPMRRRKNKLTIEKLQACFTRVPLV